MNTSVELRHLRYFVAVAEELHFGRAAERLHIAQPPLSQQIRRLEEIVGHQLFHRTSRSVKLTAAGELLLERALQILSRVEGDLESVRAVGRGETGTLTLGFVGSAMLTPLPSVLGRYRKLFPKVKLRLREYYTANLMEALREGTADVGILRDGDRDESLGVEQLHQEPFITVLPASHPLAALKAVPIGRMKNEPFVLFARSVGETAWRRTVQVCERHGFQPNVVQEGPQWLTILRLVGAGLGITIAPACVSAIADRTVACRRLSPAGSTTSIDLAYHADRLRPNSEAFCQLARRVFAETSATKRPARSC